MSLSPQQTVNSPFGSRVRNEERPPVHSLAYVGVISWTDRTAVTRYIVVIYLPAPTSNFFSPSYPLSQSTMRPPLLLLALMGPLPSTAFYPTKFRANLSMIPGISHEQMTEEVLTSVVTSLFQPVAEALNGSLGAPLSRGMLDARTEIVRSNVWVDWGYATPGWHFDGESDEESAQLLQGAKAAVVKHLMDGDIREARINLGHALHLMQDYFTHGFVCQVLLKGLS